MPLNSESAREYDVNGFMEIKGNPISKVGVFPYSGEQISNDLDPGKIYNIYRPIEELSNTDTIESFKLIPFTDDHAMLGSEDGMLAAEEKGVHGVIGEDVYFEDGYLKANIKIFSEKLAKLISDGKRELSIGYRCLYDMTDGVYNGQRYDGIQRSIKGNHLALVDEGRSGHDVSVLDSFKFTIDSREQQMADMDVTSEIGSNQIPGESMNLEDLGAKVLELEKMLHQALGNKQADEGEKEDKEDKEDKEEKQSEDEEGAYKKFVNKAEVEDEDNEEEENLSQDDGGETEKKDGDMSKSSDKNGMDTKAFLLEISQRDKLAKGLSNHIGTFDHSLKTTKEVAQYGIKKLGLKCQKGHEISMLTGYLAASKNSVLPVMVKDSAHKSSCIDSYLNGVQ